MTFKEFKAALKNSEIDIGMALVKGMEMSYVENGSTYTMYFFHYNKRRAFKEFKEQMKYFEECYNDPC